MLLAIQDTTTCIFDTHHSLDGLGAILSNQSRSGLQGLHVHNTLLSAADEDAVFGLLGAKLYPRKATRKKQVPGTRNRERIEDKESVRWLESLALACEACQWLQQSSPDQGADATAPLEAPLIVSVGDRRRIFTSCWWKPSSKTSGCGSCAAQPHAGSFTLQLPRSQGQKTRQVTLSVRFSSVTIAVPAHKAKYLKMDTLDTDVQLTRWYAKRWQIEVFHRILKTGRRVEARQMRSLERLKPMMALDMMVACRIMGMSAAARQRPVRRTPGAQERRPSRSASALARPHQARSITEVRRRLRHHPTCG